MGVGERLRPRLQGITLWDSKSSERAAQITRAISRMSSASNPRVASAGVPIRRPEVTIGGRGSNGTALRLTVMPISCEAVLGLLAVELRVAQVDEDEVHVGAAGEHGDAGSAIG